MSFVEGLLRGRQRAAPSFALLAALTIAGCGGSGATHTGGAGTTASAATTTRTVTATSSSGASSAGAATTSTAPSAGAASLSTCRTRNLRLSMISGQGAAGTAFITYGLTNVGTASCTLLGYPGVAVLDGAGHIVQHAAKRGAAGPSVPVRRVTLPPGARAKFLVTSTDVIPSPGCPHTFTGVTLQVFAPNQRAAIRRSYSGRFCNLRVGPVQRG